VKLTSVSERPRELVVPHCTYTDPEVAQVGLTPRQASDAGIAIDEYRLALAKVERAFIDGKKRGLRRSTPVVALARSSERHGLRHMPVK
jgi:pyruvate/2-oxoglutarate dehydrogenase complex dihydrolipoamide dehydrogenase (E3) component